MSPRPRQDQNTGAKAYIGTCRTCGKRCYPTKADAKKAIRQLPHKKGGRLSVYPCGPYWHFGHLPKQIRTGDATRDDLLKPTRTRRGRH